MPPKYKKLQQETVTDIIAEMWDAVSMMEQSIADLSKSTQGIAEENKKDLATFRSKINTLVINAIVNIKDLTQLPVTREVFMKFFKKFGYSTTTIIDLVDNCLYDAGKGKTTISFDDLSTILQTIQLKTEAKPSNKLKNEVIMLHILARYLDSKSPPDPKLSSKLLDAENYSFAIHDLSVDLSFEEMKVILDLFSKESRIEVFALCLKHPKINCSVTELTVVLDELFPDEQGKRNAAIAWFTPNKHMDSPPKNNPTAAELRDIILPPCKEYAVEVADIWLEVCKPKLTASDIAGSHPLTISFVKAAFLTKHPHNIKAAAEALTDFNPNALAVMVLNEFISERSKHAITVEFDTLKNLALHICQSKGREFYSQLASEITTLQAPEDDEAERLVRFLDSQMITEADPGRLVAASKTPEPLQQNAVRTNEVS